MKPDLYAKEASVLEGTEPSGDGDGSGVTATIAACLSRDRGFSPGGD